MSANDAAGHRVDDVRLFGQLGQPLQVASDVVPVPTGPDGWDLVAWPPGQRALSVFPLRLLPAADPWVAPQGAGPNDGGRSPGRLGAVESHAVHLVVRGPSGSVSGSRSPSATP